MEDKEYGFLQRIVFAISITVIGLFLLLFWDGMLSQTAITNIMAPWELVSFLYNSFAFFLTIPIISFFILLVLCFFELICWTLTSLIFYLSHIFGSLVFLFIAQTLWYEFYTMPYIYGVFLGYASFLYCFTFKDIKSWFLRVWILFIFAIIIIFFNHAKELKPYFEWAIFSTLFWVFYYFLFFNFKTVKKGAIKKRRRRYPYYTSNID